MQAIHKQSFKRRQRVQQAGPGQQPPSNKRRTTHPHADTDLTAASPVPADTAAAPPAAAAGGASDVEAVEQDGVTNEASGMTNEAVEVAAQVYQALAVWPPGLQYLGQEAAAVLMLPSSEWLLASTAG